jgi:hypothetical protein
MEGFWEGIYRNHGNFMLGVCGYDLNKFGAAFYVSLAFRSNISEFSKTIHH